VSEYKLSIVIPTFNRPEMLPIALRSALDQIVPAKIIVADDGDIAVTRELLKGDFAEPCLSGQIEHLCTGASYAWPNWKAGAEAATTPYVAWLQDDDSVHPCYAERICKGFDEAPDANVWFARLQCAGPGKLALWYSGIGPWVPMDLQFGEQYCMREGSILATTSLFTSWSISPGIAYRSTPHFRDCLNRHPEYCDIYVERLLPAMVANGGPFIADPMICGYWRQHPDNLSRKQHPEQPEHTKRFLPALNELISQLKPGWKESLAAWSHLIPAGQLLGWVNQIDVACKEGGGSPYRDEIKRIMILALRDRVQFGGERRWWKRAANWFTGKAQRWPM
jgi:glycosyltransferase involved in cell wall biosynthesis